MKNERTTIKDIAKLAGVSSGTVHRALHGKKGVSDTVRDEILKIAQEHDFQLNTVAASLKRKPLRIIVCLPGPVEQNRYYYTDVWHGMREAVQEVTDLNVEMIEIPFFTGTTTGQAASLNGALARYGDSIDGLLTVGMVQNDQALRAVIEKYDARNIPVVLACDDIDRCKRLACIRPNYEVSGQVAAELLSSQIPKNSGILICAGDLMIPSHYLVNDGFQKYLTNNRPDLTIHAVYGYFNLADVYRNISDILQENENIEAVFSVNSRCSVLLSEILTEQGKKPRFMGSDLFPENIACMKSGQMHNILYKNPHRQSYLATKLLLDHLIRGAMPYNDTVYVQSSVIFQSNLFLYE